MSRALFFAMLYASAFVLNFCWESWQGVLYGAHQALAASVYVPMMVNMSLLDALSVIGLYLFTALFIRSVVWPVGTRALFIFSLSGVASSWMVEYLYVYILHAWSYTPAMPLLFGVGLTPLLQIAATGLVAVFTARAAAGFRKPEHQIAQTSR